MTGTEINAIVASIILALGIVAPVPDFAAGLILAFGMAYAVRSMRSVDSRKGYALSLFMGALFAIIVAGLHKATANIWGWGSLTMQAQMAIAGGLSQSIAEGFIAFGGGLKEQLGKLPGRFKLPGDEP